MASGKKSRLSYLFGTPRGLVLLTVLALLVAGLFLSLLCEPLVGTEAIAWMKEHLGLSLLPAEREGRLVILYHILLMPLVAIETYFITGMLPMRKRLVELVNVTITAGWASSLVGGVIFAYFGHDFAFHAIFIFGQCLIFFGGVTLCVALWPWSEDYRTADPERSRTRKGVDLERVAFFFMAVATIGSALFGAAAGSRYGTGFTTFLAEDVVREPEKSPLQLAVIGHLHIMLVLIAVALFLIVCRALGFRGKGQKVAMPLIIAGTLVITGGVWAVVPFEAVAHIIINVGTFPILGASFCLVYFGWKKAIRDGRTRGPGEEKASKPRGALRALLSDPLRFGTLWQMIYMNVVVTAVGIYMAMKLDAIVRTWPGREERIALVGHWHVLWGIIATIVILFFADVSGLKGRARKVFGWSVIIGSDIAFAAAAVYEIRKLLVADTLRQPLVDWTHGLMGAGIGLSALASLALVVWRVVDLCRSDGRWKAELAKEVIEIEEEAKA